MQLQSDKSNRLEEVKTQFRAREGYYRLMNSPDYAQRTQRTAGYSNTTSGTSSGSSEKAVIKISMVTVNDSNNNNIKNSLETLRQSNVRGLSGSSSNNTQRRSTTKRSKKICFNVGREIFVYNYDSVRTGPDATNHLYRKTFKSAFPTCHDFNQASATPESLSLLIGFSIGHVTLINISPGCDDTLENSKEFNVDRIIDKTRVTCVKWLPNSTSLFLVGHSSGQLYLYKDDLPCGPTSPTYQLYKQSDGVMVYTCKTKTSRNPIYKWSIGGNCQDGTASTSSSALLGSSSSLHKVENECYALNEFCFSPCAKYLACASQDGFMRVFCYDTMELVGRCRSYYGGLTCVCWSPDGKYVVTGGEDDLITLWSFVERRVVARGMGHKSWVSFVSFDSYYTGYEFTNNTDADDDEDEDDEERFVEDSEFEDDCEDDDNEIRSYNDERSIRSRFMRNENMNNSISSNSRRNSKCSPTTNRIGSNENNSSNNHQQRAISYRFGSVGQDAQLCLWDLNDDLLKQSLTKSKYNSITTALCNVNLEGPSTSRASSEFQNHSSLTDNKLVKTNDANKLNSVDNDRSDTSNKPKDTFAPGSSLTGRFLSTRGSSFTKTFSLVGKRDKRNLSNRYPEKNKSNTINPSSYNTTINGTSSGKLSEDPTKLLGSPICPRMNEVPILQPSVCKKISYERLTSLIFLKTGFLTSCQDGCVISWARPSKKSTRPTINPGPINEGTI